MATKGKLTPKQLAFCREYIGNGCNATQAYIAAGYAKQGAEAGASRLLTNVKVADEIAARQARKREVADVTVAEVLGRLREDKSTRATELLGKHIGMWGEGGAVGDSWDDLVAEANEPGS